MSAASAAPIAALTLLLEPVPDCGEAGIIDAAEGIDRFLLPPRVGRVDAGPCHHRRAFTLCRDLDGRLVLAHRQWARQERVGIAVVLVVPRSLRLHERGLTVPGDERPGWRRLAVRTALPHCWQPILDRAERPERRPHLASTSADLDALRQIGC